MKILSKILNCLFIIAFAVSSVIAESYNFKKNFLAPMSSLKSSFVTFSGTTQKFTKRLLNAGLNNPESDFHRKLLRNSFSHGEVLAVHSTDNHASHMMFNGITILTTDENDNLITEKVNAEGKRMATKGKTNRNKVLEEGIQRLFDDFLMYFKPELLDNKGHDHAVNTFTAPAGTEDVLERLYINFRKKVILRASENNTRPTEESTNAHKILTEFSQIKELAELTINNKDYENVLRTAFEEHQKRDFSRDQIIEASYMLISFIRRIKEDKEFWNIKRDQETDWQETRKTKLKEITNILDGTVNKPVDIELSTLMKNIMIKSRTNLELRDQTVDQAEESRKKTIEKLMKELEPELRDRFKINNKNNNLTYSDKWKEIAVKTYYKERLKNEARDHYIKHFIFKNDSYINHTTESSIKKEAPKGSIPINFDYYTHGGRTDLQSEDTHFKQIRKQMPVQGRVIEIEKRYHIINRLQQEKSEFAKLKEGKSRDAKIHAIDLKIIHQMAEIEMTVQALEEVISEKLSFDAKEEVSFYFDIDYDNIRKYFTFNKKGLWQVRNNKGQEFSITRDQAEFVRVPNMKALKKVKTTDNLDKNNPDHWVEVLAVNGKPITGDWDVFETGVLCKNQPKKILKILKDRSRIIKNDSKGYGQKSDKRMYVALNSVFKTFNLPSPIQHHASKHSVLAERGEEIKAAYPLLLIFMESDGKFEVIEVKDEEEYNEFKTAYGMVTTQNPFLPAEPVKKLTKYFKNKAKALKQKAKSA